MRFFSRKQSPGAIIYFGVLITLGTSIGCKSGSLLSSGKGWDDGACKGHLGKLLTLGEGSSGPLVAGNRHVYWYDPEELALRRSPKNGGGDDTLVSGVIDSERKLFSSVRLALDRKYLYRGVHPEGTVKRIPIGGGAPQRVARGGGPASRLFLAWSLFKVAADASGVYFGQSGGWDRREGGGGGRTIYLAPTRTYPGSIHRIGRNGKKHEVLAAQQHTPWDIAVGKTHIYWKQDRGIRAVSKSGGDPVALDCSYQTTGSLGLVPRGGTVYWAEPEKGAIMRGANSGR